MKEIRKRVEESIPLYKKEFEKLLDLMERDRKKALIPILSFHLELLGKEPNETVITREMLKEYGDLRGLNVFLKERAKLGEFALGLYTLKNLERPDRAPRYRFNPIRRYLSPGEEGPKDRINHYEVSALLYRHQDASLALAYVALAPFLPIYEPPSIYPIIPKHHQTKEYLMLEEVKDWDHNTEEKVQKMALIYYRANEVIKRKLAP